MGENCAIGPRCEPICPDYSVIVPCFQEEASIEAFHNRLTASLAKLEPAFEIIYISDGSTDGTWARLEDIFERDPTVTCVMDFARNFGQTNAQTAGVQHASGRHIIFMDCDLQLNPEDLGLLLAKFDGTYDMVGGARDTRCDSLFRVWLSRAGNAVISRILGVPMRDLGCGMKVVDGSLLRAFDPGPYRPLDPGEQILCLRRVAEVPISHRARTHGRSRWTWRRIFILYHNIFSSLLPAVYPFIVGILFLWLIAIFGYLTGAWIAPSLLPLPPTPIAALLLATLYMIINLGFFLALGEFMLHGSTAANERAYLVRRMRTRPWASPQRDSETTAMAE